MLRIGVLGVILLDWGVGLVSALITAAVRRVPKKTAPPPANHCQFPWIIHKRVLVVKMQIPRVTIVLPHMVILGYAAVLRGVREVILEA